MDKIQSVLKKLGIVFNNLSLYETALSHPSYANENKGMDNYQKLEFLGDSVLNKFVVEYIYNKYSSKHGEGTMSIIKNNAIKMQTLAEYSKKIGLSDTMRVGKNNDIFRNSERILEDIFEAFVGAIYLDLGQEEVDKFLNKTITKFIDNFDQASVKNPKTLLQEYLQAESRKNVEYNTVMDKQGNFTSEVIHNDAVYGKGKGKTKKEAEVNAASKALELL